MKSPTNFYHVIQIILCMWSCDESLLTVAFLWENVSFYKDLTRKTAFFEGWSCFKFNNFGLTLRKSLKFYTSVAKGLKLKVEKFFGLNPTFIEVTGENLVEGAFFAPLFWIRLKEMLINVTYLPVQILLRRLRSQISL